MKKQVNQSTEKLNPAVTSEAALANFRLGLDKARLIYGAALEATPLALKPFLAGFCTCWVMHHDDGIEFIRARAAWYVDYATALIAAEKAEKKGKKGA